MCAQSMCVRIKHLINIHNFANILKIALPKYSELAQTISWTVCDHIMHDSNAQISTWVCNTE